MVFTLRGHTYLICVIVIICRAFSTIILISEIYKIKLSSYFKLKFCFIRHANCLFSCFMIHLRNISDKFVNRVTEKDCENVYIKILFSLWV